MHTNLFPLYTILEDDEVEIVIEVMGGLKPAYDFVKKSLLAGKSVCTSNKELVAKYGAELIQIAKDHNRNFLFEASVGGGIPIIRPLNQHITADEICEIAGILNGKTIKEAMDTASKASAIAVSRQGAAPSIPYLKEVEEYKN